MSAFLFFSFYFVFVVLQHTRTRFEAPCFDFCLFCPDPNGFFFFMRTLFLSLGACRLGTCVFVLLIILEGAVAAASFSLTALEEGGGGGAVTRRLVRVTSFDEASCFLLSPSREIGGHAVLFFLTLFFISSCLLMRLVC